MQVLFPKINHLFSTFVFMIRPYYASKISGEMMHAILALKTKSVTTV